MRSQLAEQGERKLFDRINPALKFGAREGNRTLVTSLEGWSSTTELLSHLNSLTGEGWGSTTVPTFLELHLDVVGTIPVYSLEH